MAVAVDGARPDARARGGAGYCVLLVASTHVARYSSYSRGILEEDVVRTVVVVVVVVVGGRLVLVVLVVLVGSRLRS